MTLHLEMLKIFCLKQRILFFYAKFMTSMGKLALFTVGTVHLLGKIFVDLRLILLINRISVHRCLLCLSRLRTLVDVTFGKRSRMII